MVFTIGSEGAKSIERNRTKNACCREIAGSCGRGDLVLMGSLVFGEKSVVMYSGYPRGPPGGAMTSSLTGSWLYLFPLTSETQLTLAVVVRILSPIGYGFVQPARLSNHQRSLVLQ